MTRPSLLLSAALGMGLAGGILGCGGVLDTRDRAPSEILASCSVGSNGTQTVLSLTLASTRDNEPLVLHEKDAAMTHDAAGERALAPFTLRETSGNGDTVAVTGYEAMFPATTKPTLGLLIDSRPIRWAELTLPAAPALEIVEGPVRSLAWSPATQGHLVLFAACDDARAVTHVADVEIATESSRRGLLRVPDEAVDAGQGRLELAKLDQLLFGLDGQKSASSERCASLHVVASRTSTATVDVGMHSTSSCTLEQTRSITFPRSAPTDEPVEQ